MTSNIATINAIPEGYILIKGPDNQQYVIPQFMVPAFHQMFDGFRKRKDLKVYRAAGSVSHPAIYVYT